MLDLTEQAAMISRALEALGELPDADAPDVQANIAASDFRREYRIFPSSIASPRERRAAAWHESSHCAAALDAGFFVESVEIFSTGGGKTLARLDSGTLAQARAVAVVYLSGTLAQERVDPGAVQRACGRGRGTGDFWEAKRVIDRWPTLTYRGCAVAAVLMVEAQWPVIDRIARALHRHGSLDGFEILRA